MALNLKKLQRLVVRADDRKEIEIPEIEEGEVALVRALTVRDKSILSNHSVSMGGLKEHSAMCIIAALGTVDDVGDLLFGRNRGEAIEFVSTLPERYWGMVGRLSHGVLEMTALAGEDASGKLQEAKGKDGGSAASANGHDVLEGAVEAAEKN